MPCIDAAIAAGAIHVLDTIDASAAIDAINAASAAGGAIEATGMMAAIAGWLLAVSWQLLPLTAVVIILDLALRRAGPVVRSALWWMVLAKLIVPPGIASPVSIAQLWPVDGVSAIITDSAAAPRTDRRTWPSGHPIRSRRLAMCAGARQRVVITAGDANGRRSGPVQQGDVVITAGDDGCRRAGGAKWLEGPGPSPEIQSRLRRGDAAGDLGRRCDCGGRSRVLALSPRARRMSRRRGVADRRGAGCSRHRRRHGRASARAVDAAADLRRRA